MDRKGAEMNAVERERGLQRWHYVLLATVFLAAFFTSFAPALAQAGRSDSAYGYVTVNGAQFRNRAFVETSGTEVWALAGTSMGHTDGSTPLGHAGARGRLFTAGGVLSCEGLTRYNTTTAYVAAGSCLQQAKGGWYSYGVSQAWNGSSYGSYYTFRSANQYS